MTGVIARCLLLHGVVEAPPSTGELRSVRAGRVAAVFDELPPDVGDDDDVAELARRHDEVLRSLLAAGPVLPVRLGTVCADEGQLAALLHRGESRLAAELARLRGRCEWRLRVGVSPPTGPQSAHPAAAPAESGTSYLMRKRAEQHAQRSGPDAAGAAFDLLDAALQRLADAAADAHVACGGAVRGRSYLVRRDREPELEALPLPAGAERLDITLIGPLPAYSFVDVTLEVPQ